MLVLSAQCAIFGFNWLIKIQWKTDYFHLSAFNNHEKKKNLREIQQLLRKKKRWSNVNFMGDAKKAFQKLFAKHFSQIKWKRMHLNVVNTSNSTVLFCKIFVGHAKQENIEKIIENLVLINRSKLVG